MEEFASYYEKVVDKTVPPGIVLIVNSKGQLYHRAFGHQPSDGGSIALNTDAVFQIASCTKLITTIAALQCVEKGLMSLDGDISDILTELKSLPVLEEYEENGNATIRKNNDTITLRQLLTHSAGFKDDEDSILARYVRENDVVVDRSVTGRWLRPLRYKPGQGWWYSGGLDWAGKAIERVTGYNRLGEYMQENIFKPLNIKRFEFQLSNRPDMARDLTQLWDRDETGSLIKVDNPLWEAWGKPDDLGGGGLFGTVEDYGKIQTALLKNDGTLLKPETVQAMFEPQLADARYLEEWVKNQSDRDRRFILQTMSDKVALNFGLGGLLNTDGISNGRGRRTLTWQGAWNAVWWIDRENDIAGYFATSFQTFGDDEIISTSIALETAAYKEFVYKDE